MNDLFAAAPKDLRAARLRGYHQYLVERDGELDVKARSLSRRELSIERYETAPAITRDIDAAEFRQQYVAFDKRKAHSPDFGFADANRLTFVERRSVPCMRE
jgi:hypothetical protein